MQTLSVTLSRDDAAKLRLLQKKGVRISNLVRTIIRNEYAIQKQIAQAKKRRPGDLIEKLKAIHAKYPDPPDLPPRSFDLRDRKAVQRYIAEKIRAKIRRTTSQ